MFADIAEILADGLDVPSEELVQGEPENRFLSRVASVRHGEALELLSGWLEEGTPGSRLQQLRRAYFDLFLRPDAPVPIYLMQMGEACGAEVLAAWEAFLDKAGMRRGREWRNGVDHVSVIMECLARLEERRDPLLQELVQRFLKPRFCSLADGLNVNAKNAFYQSMAMLCMELNREITSRFD